MGADIILKEQNMPSPMFKERVECALPARMMYTIAMANVFVIHDGYEDEAKAAISKLRDLLKVACLEPLDGLGGNVQRVIAKIVDRVHRDVMSEYSDQRSDKVATAIYYFLKYLTDSGYLELWEGSPVAEAAALYLPMIEHVFEQEKLDSSAQKQARKILTKLQEKGYYQ